MKRLLFAGLSAIALGGCGLLPVSPGSNNAITDTRVMVFERCPVSGDKMEKQVSVEDASSQASTPPEAQAMLGGGVGAVVIASVVTNTFDYLMEGYKAAAEGGDQSISAQTNASFYHVPEKGIQYPKDNTFKSTCLVMVHGLFGDGEPALDDTFWNELSGKGYFSPLKEQGLVAVPDFYYEGLLKVDDSGKYMQLVSRHFEYNAPFTDGRVNNTTRNKRDMVVSFVFSDIPATKVETKPHVGKLSIGQQQISKVSTMVSAIKGNKDDTQKPDAKSKEIKNENKPDDKPDKTVVKGFATANISFEGVKRGTRLTKSIKTKTSPLMALPKNKDGRPYILTGKVTDTRKESNFMLYVHGLLSDNKDVITGKITGNSVTGDGKSEETK